MQYIGMQMIKFIEGFKWAKGQALAHNLFSPDTKLGGFVKKPKNWHKISTLLTHAVSLSSPKSLLGSSKNARSSRHQTPPWGSPDFPSKSSGFLLSYSHFLSVQSLPDFLNWLRFFFSAFCFLRQTSRSFSTALNYVSSIHWFYWSHLIFDYYFCFLFSVLVKLVFSASWFSG